eukprot:1393563-Pyramimonas_sp.AAC.1
MGGAEAAVHGGGSDTVAGVPRQGVRKIARVATAGQGDARGFGGSLGSAEEAASALAPSDDPWVSDARGRGRGR